MTVCAAKQLLIVASDASGIPYRAVNLFPSLCHGHTSKIQHEEPEGTEQNGCYTHRDLIFFFHLFFSREQTSFPFKFSAVAHTLGFSKLSHSLAAFEDHFLQSLLSVKKNDVFPLTIKSDSNM